MFTEMKLKRASRLLQLVGSYRAAVIQLKNVINHLEAMAAFYERQAHQITQECQKDIPGVQMSTWSAGQVPYTLRVGLILTATNMDEALQRGVTDREFNPEMTQPIGQPRELSEYWLIDQLPTAKPNYDFSDILRRVRQSLDR